MAREAVGLTLEGLGVEPPYSMPAEQSVLGAMLADPDSVDISMRTLRPEMFYVRQNRAVFAEVHMLVANSKPVDVVVLADRLAAENVFANVEEARAYLMEMAVTVPTISNLPSYIDIVQEKYIKRLLVEEARNILEQSADDVEAKTMLEGAEQRLYEIRSGGRDSSEVQPLRFAVVEIMQHLHRISGENRKDYLGIKTGYRLLDYHLTGLGRSDLLILAARPGVGKTSFALNIAMNVAKQDIPVMIFSLEMTKDQLAGRLLSAEAMADSRIFRTGDIKPEDWEGLTEASEVISQYPVFLDDSSAIGITEMKSKIRAINREANATGAKPIGLVIIDYLQLMHSARRVENRVQEISEITRNLKIMAKDLNLPVMALSQLSRSIEKGGADRRPMLSDLRDSGSIEQDADVVMFLQRAYYEDQSESEMMEAECIIAKNRHGDTANVPLLWDGTHTRFISPEYNY